MKSSSWLPNFIHLYVSLMCVLFCFRGNFYCGICYQKSILSPCTAPPPAFSSLCMKWSSFFGFSTFQDCTYSFVEFIGCLFMDALYPGGIVLCATITVFPWSVCLYVSLCSCVVSSSLLLFQFFKLLRALSQECSISQLMHLFLRKS